jgi:hypothetical protein
MPRTSSSGVNTPWRAASVAATRLMARTVRCLTACGDVALAVACWTFTQILEGCAAYGMALYPIPMVIDEDFDRRNPAGGPQAEPGDLNQLTAATKSKIADNGSMTHRDPPKYNDCSPKDVGVSRGEIEHIVRRGDRGG